MGMKKIATVLLVSCMYFLKSSLKKYLENKEWIS